MRLKMSTYNGPRDPSTPVRQVTGQFLAKNKKPAWWRARLAVDMLEGRADIVRPCIKQVAVLCRVPLASVHRALNGKRPKPKQSLADMLASASPAERAEAAARLGPGVVWDTMISPLLEQERAIQQAAE
jgi:hypothetical protein